MCVIESDPRLIRVIVFPAANTAVINGSIKHKHRFVDIITDSTWMLRHGDVCGTYE